MSESSIPDGPPQDDASQNPRLPTPRDLQVYEGAAALARLGGLDLEAGDLIDVVIGSEIERRSTSPLEPSGASGSRAYFAGCRILAEKLLAKEDWVREELNNLPRMVHKQTGVAVVVSSGDSSVGLHGRSPRSKNSKGNESASIVVSNARQLVLFGDQPRFRRQPRAEEQITWLLLIFSDELQTLRAELSLPVGLDDADHFSQWKERILLNVPSYDAGLRRFVDDSGEPEFEVTIRSKK